jgi:hypothetical protein
MNTPPQEDNADNAEGAKTRIPLRVVGWGTQLEHLLSRTREEIRSLEHEIRVEIASASY